jgi:hypothetical protein
MTTYGTFFIDLLSIGLILLIINLVRQRMLSVGYALVWLGAVIFLMAIVTIPVLMFFITKAVGAIYPASAISLLAFVFIFVNLIFFSVQLSILSARQVEVIQAISILTLENQELTKQDQENHAVDSLNFSE